MNRRLIIPPLATLAAGALVFLPGPGQAATRTQTLRIFDKPVSLKVTHTDGSVETSTLQNKKPLPPPKPGDTLDVNSRDYRGTHARHSKRSIGSTHLRCVFGTGEPTCESHVAIGGSMLIFTGNPGKLTNGTGIYEGATGRIISSKELADNASDIVARITLRG